MKIAFYTLGCKTNQYETQAMERLLVDMGHVIGSFDESCDAYVINTCSVTAVADKKNRAIIRRCRRDNPNAVIGVCGCYSQHDAEAVRNLGADVIGGSGQRQQFVDMLLEAAATKQKQESVDAALRRREFEVLPAGGLEERTRAMLKVQDGCVNFCTYCIIPYARGPVRSQPLSEAVEQAKQLADMGYRELIVTGIEISSWGKEFKDGTSLIDLLEAVCAAAPECRIRLGSLDPTVMTPDFVEKISGLTSLAPHFHLSMQSGCSATLARMRRKYNRKQAEAAMERVRRAIPAVQFTTDMIVGFPGETPEEFAESREFAEQAGFLHIHVFPYSKREGTPAAVMKDQIPEAVKHERVGILSRISEESCAHILDGVLADPDTPLTILPETRGRGFVMGHTPDFLEVKVLTDRPLSKTEVTVRPLRREGEILVCELMTD